MEQWQIVFWTVGAVFGALTFIVMLIKGFSNINKPDESDKIVQLTKITLGLDRAIQMADKSLEKHDSARKVIDDVSRVVDRTHQRIGKIDDNLGLIAKELFTK